MIEPDKLAVGSAEFARINDLVGALSGTLCWKVDFSYGDELYADFGARLTQRRGPRAGTHYGEWELGASFSAWIIRHADGSGVTSGGVDRQTATEWFSEITDRLVVSAAVSLPDLDLLVEFDGGHQLEIKACHEEGANPEGDEGDEGGTEIPCWDLCLPDDQILEVWPGKRWSLAPYERG